MTEERPARDLSRPPPRPAGATIGPGRPARAIGGVSPRSSRPATGAYARGGSDRPLPIVAVVRVGVVHRSASPTGTTLPRSASASDLIPLRNTHAGCSTGRRASKCPSRTDTRHALQTTSVLNQTPRRSCLACERGRVVLPGETVGKGASLKAACDTRLTRGDVLRAPRIVDSRKPAPSPCHSFDSCVLGELWKNAVEVVRRTPISLAISGMVIPGLDSTRASASPERVPLPRGRPRRRPLVLRGGERRQKHLPSQALSVGRASLRGDVRVVAS